MKNTHSSLIVLSILSVFTMLFSGCGKKEAPVEPVAVRAEPVAAAAGKAAAKAPLPGDKAMAAAGARQAPAAPAGHGAMGGAAAAQAGPTGPSGEVLEALDAGTYTYLKIKTADGEIWAAVPATPAKVGDKVALAGAMEMKNFKSKTLKRDFPSVWFGTLAKPGAAGVAGAVHGGAPAAGQAGAKPADGAARAKAAATKTEPVAKAEGPGAMTVAEIWAKRKELAGKQVTVRGRVVRYSANIMGSNWLHLQDGSGSVADKTHDVTATSKTPAKVGDVLVVSGAVAIDRNIGAGYNYPVLIENAALTE